jgi:hypothetical protein
LWRNQQAEACLILRLKLRNHRGDFESQITKPELLVLRPKPGNLPPHWFWGSTKKPTAGFDAKLGETVTTSFKAKLEKTVTTGFETKPLETITTDFEAKPAKTVTTSFEAKPVKNRPSGFEAKPLTNCRPWF